LFSIHHHHHKTLKTLFWDYIPQEMNALLIGHSDVNYMLTEQCFKHGIASADTAV
jgi:hypothetical protein